MYAELTFPQTAVFRSVIHTFRSVNKFLYLQPTANGLELSSLSASKTCWLQITLHSTFFNCFILSAANKTNEDELFSTKDTAGAMGTSAASKGCVAIPLKPLFRTLGKIPVYYGNSQKKKDRSEGNPGRSGLKVERIHLEDIPEKHIFVFKFVFREFGSILLLTFSYQENQLITPQKFQWKLRHSFRIFPQTLMKVLDIYCPMSEDITLIPNAEQQTVRFQTAASDLESASINAQTHYSGMPTMKNNFGEILLDSGHLKMAHFEKRLPSDIEVTFSAREFRSVVSLCDSMNTPLTITFQTPGLPVVVLFGKLNEALGQRHELFDPAASLELLQLTREHDRDDSTAWVGMLWTSTAPLADTSMEYAEEAENLTHNALETQVDELSEGVVFAVSKSVTPIYEEASAADVQPTVATIPGEYPTESLDTRISQHIDTDSASDLPQQTVALQDLDATSADLQLQAYGFKNGYTDISLSSTHSDDLEDEEEIDAEIVDLAPDNDVIDDDLFDMMNLW